MGTLAGREAEVAKLTALFRAFFRREASHGQALYVSGMPGTGKSASVALAVENCRRSEKCLAAAAGAGAGALVVEVCGMSLPRPKALFQALHDALLGGGGPRRAAPGADACCNILAKVFTGGGVSQEGGRSKASRKILLILDEVDLLYTRDESVLYAVFEWATQPRANLFVVAISNTLALPLSARVRSRLGACTMQFATYTDEQLARIAAEALGKQRRLFDEGALELCAKKVSMYSGDVRRMLHVCNEAVRRTAAAGGTISKRLVAEICKNELSTANVEAAVLALSPLQRLCFSLVLTQPAGGVFENSSLLLDDIARKVQEEYPLVAATVVHTACESLVQGAYLLSCESSPPVFFLGPNVAPMAAAYRQAVVNFCTPAGNTQTL